MTGKYIKSDPEKPLAVNLEYEEGYRAGLEQGIAAYRLNRNPEETEIKIKRLWRLSMRRTDALLEAMYAEATKSPSTECTQCTSCKEQGEE